MLHLAQESREAAPWENEVAIMIESQVDFSGCDSVNVRDVSGAARAARARRRTSTFYLESSAGHRFSCSSRPRYFGTGMAGFTSVPWIGL